MEGGERAVAPPTQPHRFGSGGGVGGSEFFICFTSRPSSSSMRIPSSKSLPSPGRADKYRDPGAAATAAAPPSLSASLSRRLKSSGSVKGGQSPATIPAAGGSRRKSCAFEAAEPSSPKVTCIGQVKVKTARMKKKKKTLRSASKRATGRGGGEAIFRRLEQRGAEGDTGDLAEDRECLPNRNQRWVHLPLSSICDALRAFGSEFTCFLPCGGRGRSHSSSSAGVEREKGERAGGFGGGNRVEEKGDRGSGMWSCGAALARWLMAVQESEGVKRGEVVELVVDEVEGSGMARELRGTDVLMDAEKGGLAAKEERERMRGGALVAAPPAAADDGDDTVCVPPPNALLLMRCRSDPVRMAALANRFWGSPAARVEVEEDEEDHDEEDEVDNREEEDTSGHAAQGGEEPGEAARRGHDGGAQEAAAASVVAEALEIAEVNGLGICNEGVEGEGGEDEQQQLLLQPQHCQEKGERDGESGHRAEATPERDKDNPSWEEEGAAAAAAEFEKPAVGKGDVAGFPGSPSPVASTQKSEILLPAGVQEAAAAAGKEEATTMSAKPTSSTSERHGRRPSLSGEKEEGRRCSSREREGRRRSFSMEKEARRMSSFRDKEGRRSSFSVEGDALRSSFCAEGEGRRRWSFSSEKDVRKPLADATAQAAAVMEKKRKKKKKEEEEPGAAREDPGVDAQSFDRPTAAAAAAAPAAEGGGEAGRRGDELPDCLLLMISEPKLSMEVSRETWVCTSDFLRYRPHHHRQQPQQNRHSLELGAAQGEETRAAASDVGGGEDKVELTASSDAASHPHPSPPPPPPPPPPAAAAAHAPAAAPPTPPWPETAKTPEKKRASAAAGAASSPYAAPFGLTRCKSEPMRSSAKLEPDACFWKSRHRPIGAAGIGF